MTIGFATEAPDLILVSLGFDTLEGTDPKETPAVAL